MSEMMIANFTAMKQARRPRLDQELDAEIGRKLRARRRERGLTLQELAAISGLTVQQIQRSEAGAARVTVVVLLRLADALKTAPLALMPDLMRDDSPLAPISLQGTGEEAEARSPDLASAHELALALADYLSQPDTAAASQS